MTPRDDASWCRNPRFFSVAALHAFTIKPATAYFPDACTERLLMSDSSSSVTTVVANDGLRYKSKAPGSAFGPNATCATMSCIKCGVHRPRSLLMTKRVAGRLYLACSPSCEALKLELDKQPR
jgi:hypothetical protein